MAQWAEGKPGGRSLIPRFHTKKLGVAACAWTPSIREAEAGGSLGLCGQPA